MKSDKIRKSFLKFFEEKKHLIVPSSSLVPDNDPTVLLTTAGMQQFKQFFSGEAEPPARRLASCQKCFRTTDIDEVGDAYHHTFFEMLGNFSIGYPSPQPSPTEGRGGEKGRDKKTETLSLDGRGQGENEPYFKEETINWAWEFVTEVLKIDKEKLWVTVFKGEGEIPEDKEAAEIWKKVGISEERIIKLGRKDNFWGPAGTSGPCGPSSEIHVDLTGGGHAGSHRPGSCDCFLEIWNLVFTQFNQKEDGSLEPLPARNIDTGAGLERLARVLQNKPSAYETDLFAPIVKKIEEMISISRPDIDTKNAERRIRIIADHIRGITFLIADGVIPSNKEQGYILRRVMRRAIAQGRLLGIEKPFLGELAIVVLDVLGKAYPEAVEQQTKILEVIAQEEEKFGKTLSVAMKQLEKVTKRAAEVRPREALEVSPRQLSGKDVFFIHDSLGMPVELIEEIAKDKGFEIDRKEFERLMAEQKERARAATEKLQKEVSEELIARNHTATHLLHAALHRVLGAHALQAGSYLIGKEFRFDFTHPRPMTKQEIDEVEKLVNEWIKKDLPVTMEVKSYKEAIAEGAMALFHEKYGDQVKVYTIRDIPSPQPSPTEGRGGETGLLPKGEGEIISKELCGGPHVSHTGEIKSFKILKEQSSSAGVRRIRATVE
jgi:alanyl-tRNA synthetase